MYYLVMVVLQGTSTLLVLVYTASLSGICCNFEPEGHWQCPPQSASGSGPLPVVVLLAVPLQLEVPVLKLLLQ